MIVDTLARRGRGLGALVAVVAALLLAVPATASAALSFTATPPTPRPGEPVTFSASGTCGGPCVSWSWKVGSQTVLAVGGGFPDPVTWAQGFPTTGTFNVTLSYSRFSILPPYSFDVVQQVTVVANRAPVASFSFAPTVPVSGQSVTFTDSSTDPDGDTLTREWDTDNDGEFDDGTGPTASRTFPTHGPREVSLRVRDRLGAESIATRTVIVANAPPVVDLTVTPTTAPTGTPITFAAAASDPDGGPVTYAWDLDGDGVFNDSTLPVPPPRSYARAGARNVGVRVTDDDGTDASTTQRNVLVTITNRLPSTPTITPSPASASPGQTVQLTAATTDPEGTPLTYSWDLNDDGVFDDATGASVSRTMPAGGIVARVRATDADNGSSTSARFTLSPANRPPVASFTVSDPSPAIGQTITLTDTSTDPDGQPLTRAWDLDGDGQFNDGTGATATTSFTTWGTKTIRLRVSDGASGVVTSQAVTVRNLRPAGTLTVTPRTVPTGTNVSFSVAATDPDGGPVTYAWDLDGDGMFNDSTSATPPARSYPRSGARTIGVRVTDDDGDPATSTLLLTDTVTVTAAADPVTPPPPPPPPDPDAPPVDPPPADPPTAEPSPDVTVAGAGFVSDPIPAPAAAPAPPAATPTPPAGSGTRTTAAPLRLLRPFPRVRIQGRLTRRGARFTRITVTAPRGTRVRATCSGRGCPRRSFAQTIGRSGVLRLTRMLGTYRSGTRITIRVTRAGAIGKHTQIVIRRGKPPRRTDRCLRPGANAPTRCPAN